MKQLSHKLTALTAVVGLGLTITACDKGESDQATEPNLKEVSSASPATEEETETVTKTQKATAGVESEGLPGDFTTEDTEVFGGQLAQLRTTDIRIGSHPGYDRVVFEFEGEGKPEFHAAYTDQPLQLASGYPIEVPGDAALEIMIHGTSLDMNPESTYGMKKDWGLASGAIQSVVGAGTFEADGQYFLGLDSKREYKVNVLENPTRLVIDVKK